MFHTPARSEHPKNGRGRVAPPARLQKCRPARASESMSSRLRFQNRSSLPLFILVEQLAQLREFLLRRFTRRKGADHEIFHGPVKSPLKQIAGELLLRPFA